MYPSYSFPARPFAWLMKSKIEKIADDYCIDYKESCEPALKFNTIWVQDAENQKEIFVFSMKTLRGMSLFALHTQNKFLL